MEWNNPSAATPYLRGLASAGLTLDSAYTLPVCSPSRAALMTGVYPYRIGFQVFASLACLAAGGEDPLQRGFGKNAPEGLPLSTPLLPELLHKAGYTTHGWGKWHLGFCAEAYTPRNRQAPSNPCLQCSVVSYIAKLSLLSFLVVSM